MIKTNILLIEDVAADAKLISIALCSVYENIELRVANDGISGMYELCKKRPDLLFLDLNIPKKSGIEILEDIRSTNNLRTLPVIILTNSTSPKDVEAAYHAYCNAYIRKPVGFSKLMKAMRVVREFWIELAITSSG